MLWASVNANSYWCTTQLWVVNTHNKMGKLLFSFSICQCGTSSSDALSRCPLLWEFHDKPYLLSVCVCVCVCVCERESIIHP